MKDILKNLFLKSADYPRFQNQPFLVVDWVTTGVVLSEVSLSSGTAQVLRSQFESWPSGAQPASDPQAIGQWLKNVCEQAGLPTAAVAISVARRDLSLKLLELPNVADEELGALVALQVESRTQATGQHMAWDFLPHAASPTETSRYVTLISVSETICQTLRGAATAAGWNHLMLTSGDVLQAGQNADAAAWQQHVQANRSKLEFCLCRCGIPVASYVTALPSAGRDPASDAIWVAEQIPALSARLLASSPAAWQSAAMSPDIRLSGSLAPAIAAALHTSGVSTLLESTDERAGRALAVAAALCTTPDASAAASRCRLDLLKPRCFNLQSQNRRLVIRRTVALCAVLLCCVAAFLFNWQQSLQAELTELENQRLQLQQFVERGEDVLQRWSYVSRWQQQSLQAASEISEFARLVPDQERLIVTRLQLENMVDAKSGTLRIDGLAQAADDVLQMNGRILEHPEHYDLRPQGIEPAPQGSTFPSQFRIEAVLHKGTSVSQESR
jgi:hypothetical protein